MKLITKTSLNFLAISLMIFFIGVFLFYFLLRLHVNMSVNSEMEKRAETILTKISALHSQKSIPPNPNEHIEFKEVDISTSLGMFYSDTLFYNIEEKSIIPYRQLRYVSDIQGKKIQLNIYKSLENTDLLVVRIALIMTFVMLTLVLVLYFMNRYSSRKSWENFYDTIDQIRNYDINTHHEFFFKQSDVGEFEELNAVLNLMTRKIRHDYLNLKEYTENASHEIQTPLAIIRSKLELLLQDESFDEKQLKQIVDAYEASHRLSKLNQSLLLLAKIENRQFAETENISIKKLIEKQIDFLDDMRESKDISIQQNWKNDIHIEMNPYMSELLFMNLLKNAIRHNTKGGTIKIEANSSEIILSNSGKNEAIPSDYLTKRFIKSPDSPDSMGLGMAIIQKICQINGFDFKYDYKDSLHCFQIIF